MTEMQVNKADAQRAADWPSLPVDVGGGQILNVRVCWTAEQVKSYLARNWRGGPMVFATMAQPDYKPAATAAEHAWFMNTVKAMLGQAPAVGAMPMFAPAERPERQPAAPARRFTHIRT